MSNQASLAVPELTGIDLGYRPRGYFGPLPLETRLLARVTGYQRREILRRHLATGDDRYPPELEQSTLDPAFRTALGRIHPMYMGGEYLPPLASNETEIARVSLASTTADQISVRARRLKGAIAYRIVDEYLDDGPSYDARPRRSKQPLSLRELVAMIEGACADGGIVWSALAFNRRGGSRREDLRDFVRVSSEFYPQLASYYDARIEAWLAEGAAVSK